MDSIKMEQHIALGKAEKELYVALNRISNHYEELLLLQWEIHVRCLCVVMWKKKYGKYYVDAPGHNAEDEQEENAVSALH
ncbi:hypothetical protein DICVIV_11616 [Dictyocaulus viviparus]|uniref:Uncharacterized protein n=1 Tax=Dictyocaulus viviparus TaxID=29172 RepID=A0A0D8XFB2_DICVI|nr:hypothetical protein DICVIV_11616 [Dictyocaulus viviparus]